MQKTEPGKVARAGFLADLGKTQTKPSCSETSTEIKGKGPIPPSQASDNSERKVIAPASTLKLVSKHSAPESAAPPSAEHVVPKGSHWVDLTELGTIVVIDQPADQKCAAVGGIMAQRMKIRGVAGCVVGGRVRDMAELKDSQLPVCCSLHISAERSSLLFNIEVASQLHGSHAHDGRG